MKLAKKQTSGIECPPFVWPVNAEHFLSTSRPSVPPRLERPNGRGPDALRALLRRRAIDLGAPGKDEIYGWGFIGEEPSCAS